MLINWLSTLSALAHGWMANRDKMMFRRHSLGLHLHWSARRKNLNLDLPPNAYSRSGKADSKVCQYRFKCRKPCQAHASSGSENDAPFSKATSSRPVAAYISNCVIQSVRENGVVLDHWYNSPSHEAISWSSTFYRHLKLMQSQHGIDPSSV